MADKEISQNMQMAGGIFQEMVMEEAIKDKTQQVIDEQEQAEMMALRDQQIVQNEDDENDLDDDSDFNDDDMMQSLREQRIAQMKEA